LSLREILPLKATFNTGEREDLQLLGWL